MTDYITSACKEFEKQTGLRLKPAATPYVADLPREKLDESLACPGEHANIAASMLMRLLYPGRMAFPVIVLAIQRLAKRVTKWCKECDRRLVRLFEFCLYFAGHVLQGIISTDDLDDIELHLT